MSENSLKSLVLLGVIIGAIGIGFGAYSVLQVYTGVANGKDGDDGDDGDDGAVDYTIYKMYYCSSQSQITNALANIGTGYGTIIITDNIALSSEISINGGGNYIIQGASSVVIDCNANDEVFYITNAQSLTLKDLTIDKRDTTSNGIYINEGDDNPVYIQNVLIIGNNIDRGIYVISENVWITDCTIKSFKEGIYLDSNSAHCHILDNDILDFNANSPCAIYIRSYEDNIVSGNTIYNINSSSTTSWGIYLANSKTTTINNNIINNITSNGNSRGIFLSYSYNSTVMSNLIENILGRNNAYSENGIYLSYSDFNCVIGNLINYADCGLGNDYGINGVSSDHNIIVWNTISNIDHGVSVAGTDNLIEHNIEPP